MKVPFEGNSNAIGFVITSFYHSRKIDRKKEEQKSTNECLAKGQGKDRICSREKEE